MKKIALFLAGLLLMGGVAANAQHLIIKGGFNYSNATVEGIKSGKSGWQFGAGFQTESARGFSFQPELIYQVKGVKFNDAKNLNLGYLQVPLNVQWGPDLLIARPYIFAGPYVGIKVRNQFKGNNWNETDMKTIGNGLKKTEWGLGVGLGLDIFKFQISGKYNWNFGAIADTNALPSLEGAPRSFEISVGLKF